MKQTGGQFHRQALREVPQKPGGELERDEVIDDISSDDGCIGQGQMFKLSSVDYTGLYSDEEENL